MDTITAMMFGLMLGVGLLTGAGMASAGDADFYYEEDVATEGWPVASTTTASSRAEDINVYYDEDIGDLPTLRASGSMRHRVAGAHGFYDEDIERTEFAAFE